MAGPALVQSFGGTGNASTSVSTMTLTSVTTTAGNLIGLAIGLHHATNTISTVSDGTSNTWALAVRVASSSTAAIEFWTTTNASPAALAAATITITASAHTLMIARGFEISGANNTNPVDQSKATGSSTTGTAANSGTTAALGASNELAIGAINNDYGSAARTFTSTTFTQGAPTNSYASATTGDLSSASGTTSTELHSGELVITSTTAQAFSATLSSASNWAAAIIVIQAAAAAGAPPLPRSVLQAVNRAAVW